MFDNETTPVRGGYDIEDNCIPNELHPGISSRDNCLRIFLGPRNSPVDSCPSVPTSNFRQKGIHLRNRNHSLKPNGKPQHCGDHRPSERACLVPVGAVIAIGAAESPTVADRRRFRRWPRTRSLSLNQYGSPYSALCCRC